jgi:hypothetical protein
MVILLHVEGMKEGTQQEAATWVERRSSRFRGDAKVASPALLLYLSLFAIFLLFFFKCKKKDDNTTHVSESRTWNFFSPPRVLLKSRPRNAATFFSGKTWESNYGLPLFLFLFLTAG